MSRALATFTFDDGATFYGIYNGTVDYMQTFMVRSVDVAWLAWDSGLRPACEHDGERVVVSNSYGGEETWEGKACRGCRVFKGPFRSPETSLALD